MTQKLSRNIERLIKAVLSCRTLEQLAGAHSYALLAIDQEARGKPWQGVALLNWLKRLIEQQEKRLILAQLEQRRKHWRKALVEMTRII